MKIIKQKYLLILLVVYFLTRLINLSELAVYNDEAIYIEWGQRMLVNASPFYSLYDGKQPLIMWLFGLSSFIFPDPIWGGRFVSVVAGAFLLWGVYKISKKFFSKKVAIISTALCLLSPINLFFNRQALVETSVAAIGIWILFFSLDFIKHKKDINLIYLALLYLAAFYTKTSTFAYVFSSLVVLLIFARKTILKSRKMLLPAGIILILFMIPMIASPDFLKIFSGNSRFTLTFWELLKFPIVTWSKNIIFALRVMVFETFGVIILSLLLFDFRKINHKKYLPFVIFSLVTLSFFIFTSKVRITRYLYPLLPALYIFFAIIIVKIKQYSKLLIYPTVLIFVFFDIFMITKPYFYIENMAKLTDKSYRPFYLTYFSAGRATEEAFEYLLEKEGKNPFVIGVRLDAGNPENTILLHTRKYRNIKGVYLDSRSTILTEGDIIPSSVPIYFVARDNQYAGIERFFESEEARFYNIGGETYVAVFKIRTAPRDTTYKF